VAVVLDPGGLGTADQVRDGVRKAAAALEDVGYALEEVEPPSIELAAKTWLDMSILPLRSGWELWSGQVRAQIKRWVLAFFEAAGAQNAGVHMQSFLTRHALLRAWGEFQETYPLILAPVSAEVPFEAGWDRSVAEVAEIVRGMRMAVAINALSLPAVALPVGVADGLPQSVQVIGPRFREDLCLDAAAAIEERLGIFTPIDPRRED
jgi:amidase